MVQLSHNRSCCTPWPLLLLAGLLSGGFILNPALAEEKGASVSLRAKWRGPPYFHEAAELVAEDDREKVWKFFEASFTTEQPSDVSNCWSHILDMATSLLDNGVSKVAPLSLASRKYSAKLAMYQQMMEQSHPTVQSCCFVDVMGKVATSIEELPAAIQAGASGPGLQLFPFDHVYRSGVNRTGALHAVLYAPVGAACAKQLHFALKVAANAGHVIYAYRPVLHTNCDASEGSCTQLGAQGPLLLPGWGVEAVLKNTEYSAMDEKDRKAEAAATRRGKGKKSGAKESLGEHKGFLFDTLVERKPSLAQELLTFRDHLMSDDDDDIVKVWDLKDVGLQAAQRIMQAADPLSLFTELSQNFPSLVSSLSRQEVNSSLRQNVAHNQQYLSPGLNFMLLNGLTVDINDFDYFAFLDRLRSELQLLELLSSLGLDNEDTRQLMQLRAEDTSDAMEDARLDLGHLGPEAKHRTKVFYLNDLEKDENYGRFSRDISDVLNVYPNRLRPLALNVYQMTLVIDPVGADGLVMAEVFLKTWQDAVPVTLSMTPKVPAVLASVRARRLNPLLPEPKELEWVYKSASERFALAFLTMEEAFTSYHAMLFWIQLSNRVMRSGTWGDLDTTFNSVFEQYWQMASAEPPRSQNAIRAGNLQSKDAWNDLRTGMGWTANAAQRLLEITEWLDSKGVADFEGPTGWLNGLQIPFTSGSDVQQFQQELLYKVLMEQQRLQEAVYFGRIEDGDNIQEKLFLQSGTLMRWNPDIIAADKRKYVLLNPLVQDADFRKLVPRFARSAAASFKGDDDQLDLHPATHIVVCNLDSKFGRKLAAEALRFLIDKLPGSPSGRVLLIFNPPHQDAALPNAPPTLLEIVLHLGLAQLPQFTGASGPDSHLTSQSVLEFIGQVLGDEALALRFSGPLAANSATEVQVALEYANKAGLDAEVIKKGVLSVLHVTPDSAGVMRFRPLPEMVTTRMAHARLARSALNLEVGSSCLISNGRVVVTYTLATDAAPPAGLKEVVAEDIDLLTAIATKYQANQAMAAQVDEAYRQGRVSNLPAAAGRNTDSVVAQLDDLVAAASAAMSITSGKAEGKTMSKQLTQVLGYMKGRTVEVSPPEGIKPSGLHIVCILNPLTRPAQRISQVLNMLRTSLLAPTISLVLNPQRDLSELPLKSFYRYALPELAPADQAMDSLPGAPAAYFSRLPRKRVLTLNMDVPEAWQVEAVQAQHDLDNLRLADISEPVAYAELELSALMLTGSCIDVTAGGNRGTPPRGLQLHLGTDTQPHVVDTLVMSNLAYFQLKAEPGRWVLSLAPGRTQELYQLVSSTGLAGQQVAISAKAMYAGEEMAQSELSMQVMVSSLAGKHMILRVKKRPGKEKEDVLRAAGEEAAPEEDMWGNYYSEEDDDDDDDDSPKAGSKKLGGDVINVFTVASGHMYERLQKIMMLSVINNTKSKVKFWFISNYMSPHHKTVIPAMAEKFGFEWEFVTYKWPHWLHKQTDKQRIIWAYKILFLDVLFPLGVERIIFVDSDQVVRADLAELYHMDIKGRPYAYTPFCDNNKEMDEFRFWKGGFWASHLHGKPYHISALYLVDLKRFRAMAAGDKLRVVYDQLSKDPNSLANLDQDLPNYAQHQIPIHSLPQEWLWCESWCGNKTKNKAKTIDLCNNPKTKEPKLSAARRIIKEWPELDNMQAEFTKQLDHELGFDQVGSSSAQEKAADEAASLAEAVVAAGEGQTAEADEGTSKADLKKSKADKEEL